MKRKKIFLIKETKAYLIILFCECQISEKRLRIYLFKLDIILKSKNLNFRQMAGADFYKFKEISANDNFMNLSKLYLLIINGLQDIRITGTNQNKLLKPQVLYILQPDPPFEVT